MNACGDPPASKDAEPHCRISHDVAITVTREVSEVMVLGASPDADKSAGIATNDPKTARSCKMNEMW
jgi:hypothetical protein